MITDDDAERCVDYLRDSAKPAAKARADRGFVDKYEKVVKARLMKEHEHLPLGAQEREAYADPRYEQHLQAMSQAIQIDTEYTYLREAAVERKSAWQTMMKHLRGIT